MKVLVVTDIHAYCVNDKIYLAEQTYHIIKRYSESFGNVNLFSRVVHQSPKEKMIDATEYIDKVYGCNGYADIFKPKTKALLRTIIKGSDLVIGRFHSILSCMAADVARKNKIPFFAELMGDAWDGFWNHSLFGKVIAPYMFLKTRQAVKNADFALYVTSKFLQNRYPCKNESVSASNVLIQEAAPEILSRRLEKIEGTQNFEISLMTTAAVNVKYKGQQYVIKAIPKLNKLGIKVKYFVVGGGDQQFLRSLAAKYNVSDQVVFTGRLALSEVFDLLDKVDLYIQPSLQEGLPRSVIEAMSRACPCIGAKTAGIPELIEDKYVVKRKSVGDIVDKVSAFCNSSPEDKKATSERNFEEAKNYLEDVLNKKRIAYYEKVKSDLKGK